MGSLASVPDEKIFAEAARRRYIKNYEVMLVAAQLIANGNNVREAASVMQISHRTVESYMEKLREVHSVNTTTHLIATLIRLNKIK